MPYQNPRYMIYEPGKTNINKNPTIRVTIIALLKFGLIKLKTPVGYFIWLKINKYYTLEYLLICFSMYNIINGNGFDADSNQNMCEIPLFMYTSSNLNLIIISGQQRTTCGETIYIFQISRYILAQKHDFFCFNVNRNLTKIIILLM